MRRVVAPTVINLASIGLTFISRLLLAKVIGPNAFGVFSIWFNNVQLFGLAGMFGQQNHALRQLADPGRAGTQATEDALEILRFCTVSASLAALGGAAFFFELQGGDRWNAALQIAAVLAFSLTTILSAVHRSFGSFVIGILFDRAVPQVAFLTITVAALLGGFEMGGGIAAFTVTLALGLLPSLAYLVRTRDLSIKSFLGRVAWREQFVSTLPFFLLSVGLVINGRYLLGVAGIYFSGAELGAIGLLLTVSSLILIPGTTFNLVFGPLIARAFAGGDKIQIRQTIRRYLGAVTVISSLAGLAIVLGYERLEPLVGFGTALSPTVIVLAAATSVAAAVAAGILFVQQMGGHAHRASNAVLLTVAAKIATALLVTSREGLPGLLGADFLLGVALLLWLMWDFRALRVAWEATKSSP